MFAKAKETPFAFRFRYLTSKFFINALSISDHPVVNCLEVLSDALINNPNNFEYLSSNFPAINLFRQLSPYKQIIYKSIFLPQYQHSYHFSYFAPEIIYPHQDFLHLLDQLPKQYAQNLFMQAFYKFITRSVVFYTDGSKMEDGEYVSSACFSPQPVIQLMHKNSPYASTFSAEVWAIYNAILLLFDIHASDASIITDSMSVLKAL